MLTGIVHLFIVFYQILYPIIIQNSVLGDKIYILFHILIVLNWLLLKGECSISYIYKKFKNPNYKMGYKSFDLKDITDVIPFIDEKFILDNFIFNTIITSGLIIWTALRNNVVNIKFFTIIILSWFYVILRERKFYNKKIYDLIEKLYILDLFNTIFIILLLYISYNIVLK